MNAYPVPGTPAQDTLQTVANETLVALQRCHDIFDSLEGNVSEALAKSPTDPGVVQASVMARTKALELRNRLESLQARVGLLGS